MRVPSPIPAVYPVDRTARPGRPTARSRPGWGKRPRSESIATHGGRGMESSGTPGGGPEGQTPSSSGAPTWRSEPEAPAAGTRPGGTWASAPATSGPSAGPAGYYYGDV